MSRLNTIARAVSAETGITIGELLSKRRARPIARARHIAWLIAAELTDLSLPQIGRGFAGMDHTSVMRGIRRARELRKSDADFAKKYHTTKRRAVAELGATRDPLTESERIIGALVDRYQHKLRMMAQARPSVFMERFGNTVTA